MVSIDSLHRRRPALRLPFRRLTAMRASSVDKPPWVGRIERGLLHGKKSLRRRGDSTCLVEEEGRSTLSPFRTEWIRILDSRSNMILLHTFPIVRHFLDPDSCAVAVRLIQKHEHTTSPRSPSPSACRPPSLSAASAYRDRGSARRQRRSGWQISLSAAGCETPPPGRH